MFLACPCAACCADAARASGGAWVGVALVSVVPPPGNTAAALVVVQDCTSDLGDDISGLGDDISGVQAVQVVRAARVAQDTVAARVPGSKAFRGSIVAV